MPTMTWVAPSRTASFAASRPSRRLSAVVPAGTWAISANVAGSRPIASSAAQDRVAPLGEVRHVGRVLVGRDGRQQPAVGDRRRQRDAAPLLAAEPDRRAARRQRRRVVGRAVERVERVGAGHARVRRGLGREERPDRVDRRFEPVEPLGHRRERDPERRVLRLEPAGAEAQDEPAAGRVVHDRRGLGQDRRMAERGGQHGMAEPLAGHVVGEGGHRRERLERRARRARAPMSVRWSFIQTAVEDGVLADPRPGRVERRPVDGLRRGLDPDLDAPGHGRDTPVSALGGWRSSGRRSSPRPRDAESTSAAYLAMTPPV